MLPVGINYYEEILARTPLPCFLLVSTGLFAQPGAGDGGPLLITVDDDLPYARGSLPTRNDAEVRAHRRDRQPKAFGCV